MSIISINRAGLPSNDESYKQHKVMQKVGIRLRTRQIKWPTCFLLLSAHSKRLHKKHKLQLSKERQWRHIYSYVLPCWNAGSQGHMWSHVKHDSKLHCAIKAAFVSPVLVSSDCPSLAIPGHISLHQAQHGVNNTG